MHILIWNDDYCLQVLGSIFVGFVVFLGQLKNLFLDSIIKFFHQKRKKWKFMTEKFSVVILSSNRIPLIPKKVGLNKPDLKKFDTKKSTTLDWIINTLSLYNFKKIEVVLGNDFEKTRKLNYPKVSFNNNLYWNKFGNLYSLSLVLNKIKGKCLISYGDIVFNNNALDKLLSYSDSDFVIGFDSTWRTRYVKRSKLSYKKVELISEQIIFLKNFKGYKLDENVIGSFVAYFWFQMMGMK